MHQMRVGDLISNFVKCTGRSTGKFARKSSLMFCLYQNLGYVQREHDFLITETLCFSSVNYLTKYGHRNSQLFNSNFPQF